MKQCKNCKQTIDENAKACPYCGKKQNNTAKTIIIVLLSCLALLIILVTILIVSINALKESPATNEVSIDAPKESSATNEVSSANVLTVDSHAQNRKFEPYFNTEATTNEVKALLDEIEKNNVSAEQKNELSIIGVCYLSKNVENNDRAGIYYYDIANSGAITKDTLKQMNFSSDVKTILNQISESSSYTVNVPNTIFWEDDSKGITGFENSIVQTGSTGGYYSSGYIRLIYILENNSDDTTYTNPYPNSNTISNIKEVQTQNSKFESYFATNTTAVEVKSLLSEIRTHNLTANRNGEPYTVGVCYISKDGTTNQAYGIYSMDNINITSSFFDNLYFCPDVDQINKNLKPGKNYNVNVPNQIAWQGDVNGKTGFETANNSMGQSITGNSGGYYSSGYIRLIYIIEND